MTTPTHTPRTPTLHPLTRRDFLRVGALTIGGYALSPLLPTRAASPSTISAARAPGATAKSVIMLWLNGGPAQMDTFDPKPKAGADVTGPWRQTIPTNVPGIEINGLLPLCAKQADKYTILRGMSHGIDGHETATYVMQTGTKPGAGLVYPSIGAVIAYELEKNGRLKTLSLPSFITTPAPLGRFSETGFLGAKYRSFIPGNLGDPINNAAKTRIEKRITLLGDLDTLDHARTGTFEQADEFYDKAKEMVMGKSRAAFDISLENSKTRELYGDSKFGRSCLQARRLAEAGVPYIVVNFGGWDTHRDNPKSYPRLMPQLDQGLSAILADLAQRGLLDTTIVACGGEFGRTPKYMTEPEWRGGRGHYGTAFSWVVAGGGFQAGKIVGETDNRAEFVIKRGIAPWDLSASIYKLMGIDPTGSLQHPMGYDVPVIPKDDPNAIVRAPSTGKAGVRRGVAPGEGILKEIMPA